MYFFPQNKQLTEKCLKIFNRKASGKNVHLMLMAFLRSSTSQLLIMGCHGKHGSKMNSFREHSSTNMEHLHVCVFRRHSFIV